jgi:2-methylcitrate dehydratase PrpD
MSLGPTGRLAALTAEARFADLPPDVVEHAERAVLDWLGNALAGALEAPAVMARRVAQRLGESGDATMFPNARSSAGGAAFANGVATHILELDDVHKGSTLHAAAPVIPAALAVAEREQASGEAFLLAVTLAEAALARVARLHDVDDMAAATQRPVSQLGRTAGSDS